MWYPPQQQPPPQYNWHGYVPHFSSQEQTYSKSSYYYNGDEASTTYAVPINDENESSPHCQIIHGNNVHASTPDCYVTSSTDSYTDEMSLYQTIPTRNPYWNPVIAAPTKMSVITNNTTTIITPSLPAAVTTASSSACWDWLLFPPEYYSEFYTPSSTFVHHHPQTEKQTNNDDDDYNLLVSLPTCLLALLYLTPKIIHTSDDENDSDQEMHSLHISTDEPLLSMNKIEQKKISSNLFLSSLSSSKNLNLDAQTSKPNRSSTPDTDDGYQSASDASRSDYSQQSSLNYDHHHHHNTKDDIHDHSLPTPLMPRRISYAAAVKPTIINNINKMSSLPTPISKPKQTINNSLSNDNNNNGQKLKFIAPRFERMHHAKQYPTTTTIKHSSSSSSSSNRTQVRSTNNNNNNNQRNLIVNSTRRR